MPEKNNPEKHYSFPQKVWITGGIFALIVVMLLLFKVTFSVFILVLAGAMIAVFFRGLASLIRRKVKCGPKLALAISIAGTLIIIALLFWLIGAKVQSQIKQLSDTIPVTIQNAKEHLNKSALGQKIVQKVSSPEAKKETKRIASIFFKSTFGILGDIYVILFLGIFFTASPKTYQKGIVSLVPKRGREKAEDVFDKLGHNLRNWLKGRIFSMCVVFILTAIGLVIIGIPMWIALALIAGLLNFIPNFGPLIALIPAILVALMQGTDTAAVVAGLYILVQVAESNFITPTVQHRLVNIPPALIIIAQLLVGTLTGIWGIILATPLMVIVMILVQELYVERL